MIAHAHTTAMDNGIAQCLFYTQSLWSTEIAIAEDLLRVLFIQKRKTKLTELKTHELGSWTENTRTNFTAINVILALEKRATAKTYSNRFEPLWKTNGMVLTFCTNFTG